MSRKIPVLHIVQIVAILAVICAMCVVARLLIAYPFERPAPSAISLIRPVAQPEPSAGAAQRSKSSGGRSVRYGWRGRGTASQDQVRPLGPSRSVGIMCLYYGSGLPAIDGSWQITIRADESLVYMCDL